MSQVISRGKSSCVGLSLTVQMYFLWPWGTRRFSLAQLTQPSSPHSLGLRLPGRPRRGCVPQDDRLASTCLQSHTRVPRLPLALGSKAGSLLREGRLRAATQAETPTCSTLPSAQWLPGSEEAQNTERGQPGHCWSCPSALGGCPGLQPTGQPCQADCRSRGAQRKIPGCPKAHSVALMPQSSLLQLPLARAYSQSRLHALGDSLRRGQPVPPAGTPTRPESLRVSVSG